MRERVWLLALSLCLSAAPLLAEEPVYFADETLKMAVEDALWVWDPTPTDMLGLTSLTAGSRQICSVVGLEYATNLTTLELPCNWITDVSCLSGLVNLKRLVLNNNEITDLTPLANFPLLEHLDMHDNRRLRDITPLSGLLRLQTLFLRGNYLKDITALAGLSNLQSLYLENNYIEDVAPLAGLTNLTCLDLRNNPLNRDAYDIYIPQIFDNNPHIVFSYPASSCQFILSSTAGGSIVTPGEGPFNFSGVPQVWIEAQADPGFAFVCFTGSLHTEQNPTLVAIDQDHQIIAVFVSLSDTLYVDDDAPGDPGPTDISVSDPSEDGTQDHPFDSIQEAIEVAPQDASIVVGPGVYSESLSFIGRAVTVLGAALNDPNVVDFPVIDAAQGGTAVSFTQGEDPNCVLSGFVIAHGMAQRAGAVFCSGSSPTISNCVIAGNRCMAANGAIIYCTNSSAVLVNCTITDNFSDGQGACLRTIDSPVTMINSILWGNIADPIITDDPNSPSITYTDIEGGWPGQGNLDSDPQFAQTGSWIDGESSLPTEPQVLHAVFALGDYHLRSQTGRWAPETCQWVLDDVTSPCIDAGDPNSPIRNEPNPSGGIINMGAYGGTMEASLGQ